MDESATYFERHRAHLFGVAYRMLGMREDAEDVVQEAFLRWSRAEGTHMDSPKAWLTTVVTRLSLDRLRAARRAREHYTGPWLPQPLVDVGRMDPTSATLELMDDLSLAYLTLLERLGPQERAAFLLREVYEYAYADIAGVLGKTQTACRQLVSRARGRLGDADRARRVDRVAHERLLRSFMEAAACGDRQGLKRLFAEDVAFTSDGGGRVYAVLRPLRGAERVSWLFYAIARRGGGRQYWQPASINGLPGLVRRSAGRLEAAAYFITDGSRIHAIYSVLNPVKLVHG
ncbi:RNA polymerase sigma factor SigJ [Arhodomonas sp. AD133]|uniref:RNA polymerase sigma factor SigJ n=1 Tax=Arhodomonas sp. AD133 TaxID=3415009 RepID=UPI003EC11872